MLPSNRIRLSSLAFRCRLQARTQSRSSSGGASPGNSAVQSNVHPKTPVPNTSGTPLATSSTGSWDRALQESPGEAENKRVMQAPNRDKIWSRSQNPRAKAMVGPRFEQTVMEDQPRPYAAIELIHKQHVRWTMKRQVSCDGGGGPLGHPRIFINVDKPQICWCTYCGVPYAHEHHRKMLEAQPSTIYPLEPTGDSAQVAESQRITNEALGHR